MSGAAAFRVEAARRDHVEAILAISNRAAADTIANFATSPEPLADWLATYDRTSTMFPWYVALDGEAVVGFAKSGPWSGRCAYAYAAEVTVYVDPAWHGRGVGVGLYTRLFETLRGQGYHTVLAGIALPNAASVGLHERFGLRPVGVLRRVGWKFGRWHDVGYWQGVLCSPAASPDAIRPVAEALGAGGR